MCDALLDNILIRFGSKLYRQIVDIPMGTNCASLVVDFLIANSSACATIELSILLTSCLTAIKNHVIKYYPTDYERNGKKLLKIQVKLLIH